MKMLALAVDFDGTLTPTGMVDDAVIAALERAKAAGIRLILVTGRRYADLVAAFPRFRTFDRIVAENGLVLANPERMETRRLADLVPAELIGRLTAMGVPGLQIGECVLATWTPHETAVLQAIRELGVGYHLEFNKGAVMAMPSGHSKASGLKAALDDLGISPRNTVAVGDGENDHSMLQLAEVGVAVADALPALQAVADITTDAPNAHGVIEVVNRLTAGTFAAWRTKPIRRAIDAGTDECGDPVRIVSRGAVVLVAGHSRSGKSSLLLSLIEQLIDFDYQCCVVDPEGEFSGVQGLSQMGELRGASDTEIIEQLLRSSRRSLVVDLLAIAGTDRQRLMFRLLDSIARLRESNGRPHWLVIDEAHHLFYRPTPRKTSLANVILATMCPEDLDASVMSQVTHVVALGNDADELLKQIADLRAVPLPQAVSPGRGLAWDIRAQRVSVLSPRFISGALCRHQHKYARGNLGPGRQFFFRGPHGHGQETAHNLGEFVSVAESLAPESWEFHLRRGDFARWFRDCIHDEALAKEADRWRATDPNTPSRAELLDFIVRRYCLRED